MQLIILALRGNDMEKKQILIYGDSNTFGYCADNGFRYNERTRWTGICQMLLGEKYHIIEEGLNGRTTVHDVPLMEFKNGLSYIEPCIRTNLPLDLICVKLGSNDLAANLEPAPEKIAANAVRVLKKAQEVAEMLYPHHPCKFALMAPMEVNEYMMDGPFAFDYEGMKTIEISRKLSAAYEKAAKENGFLFFDSPKYAQCGKVDGVHLDIENHKKMAYAVSDWIKDVLK